MFEISSQCNYTFPKRLTLSSRWSWLDPGQVITKFGAHENLPTVELGGQRLIAQGNSYTRH